MVQKACFTQIKFQCIFQYLLAKKEKPLDIEFLR